MDNKQLIERGKLVIPGGVNSPVRAFQSVGGVPVFAKSAKGAYLWDEEDKQYIDLIGGFGPHILGQASPIAYEGIQTILENGSSFGLPTQLEIEMAERITQLVPSIDMVRMVNSGTEATMSAIRLARGYTHKPKILKFEGCYHGHSDSLLIQSGSGTLSCGVPTSAGVLEAFIEHTLVGKFNDIEGLELIFSTWGHQIAGVIIEAVPANMGVIPPNIHFLKSIRRLTQEYGAVLIMDEVITGFRLGIAGAQGYFGIEADLTCFGKIIGGGMPIGAYGGRRDIMSCVAPLGPVYQAGTLAGNRMAMHMGLNVLNYLATHQNLYDELEARAIYLQNGMQENFKKLGIKGQINRVGSLLSLFFNDKPVNDYESVMSSNNQLFNQYFHGMLEEGVIMAPAPYEALFLSMAHTYDVLDVIIEKQMKVLGNINN